MWHFVRLRCTGFVLLYVVADSGSLRMTVSFGIRKPETYNKKNIQAHQSPLASPLVTSCMRFSERCKQVNVSLVNVHAKTMALAYINSPVCRIRQD